MRWALFNSFLLWAGVAQGLTIQVDYRYDSGGFFSASGNPDGAAGAVQARAAIEVVAARWSRVLDQTLLPVNEVDDSNDRRFGFFHPGTGELFVVSAAASSATDALLIFDGVPDANDYRDGFSIPADTWILYVGGRNIGSAGVGGTI